MKFCTKCGKELHDEAVVCTGCGCAVNDNNGYNNFNNNPYNNAYNNKPAVVDEVSVGLCVLAALIPLFGIIYWAVQHDETPKRAKACGITGIISWAVSFVLGFLSSFFIELIFTTLMLGA